MRRDPARGSEKGRGEAKQSSSSTEVKCTTLSLLRL